MTSGLSVFTGEGVYSSRSSINAMFVAAVAKRSLRQFAVSRFVVSERFSHLKTGLRILQFMACSPMHSDASSSESSFAGFRNRLGREKSPYLLQHANNPVNWYPWGNEAFEEARKRNKPIFLSVGYSTCHWCHVMEKESFENEEVGRILNEHFVAIKVDREERPDVDQVYMTFIQATQGGGGWPMSVWLTPDLKPIVGGTYFPPEDRYFGRPGFKSVLLNIAKKWQENVEGVQQQGDAILDALAQATKVKVEKGAVLPHCPEVVNKCYSMLAKQYDPVHGGFGRAPKFPQPVNLEFMFRKYADEPETEESKKALEMTLDTLRKMAMGGMHDHIGKGFHRYSTDAEWHVPHFEKMLYDQAQLAMAYATAYQISRERVFAETLRDILGYVNTCLSDKDGGFYSAEDADSFPTETSTEKKEGAFCVWTYDELLQILNAPLCGKEGVTEGDVFAFHYGAQKSGNVDPFKDPHGELTKQNVLIIKGDLDKTADKFSLAVEETRQILETACQKLSDVRQKRPRPHLDNKILTSWNGLMISGFSRAAQVLDDEDCLHRALAAIEFLRSNVFQEQNERLLRSCYFDSSVNGTVIGTNPIPGFVDDYAMLISGLLDTYEVCFDEKLLQFAERLQNIQDSLFWDKENYGYFVTAAGNESEIVLRLKDDQDGAEPSSNSVSCRNLLRLAMLLGRPELTEQAVKLMISFSDRLQRIPMAVPEMVGGLMFHFSTPKQIIICGDLNSDDTKTLIRCVNTHYLPNKVIIVTNGENAFLKGRVSILSSMERIDNKATAYVCENFTCQRPVNTVEELEKLLI